jgi:hypothetical protein
MQRATIAVLCLGEQDAGEFHGYTIKEAHRLDDARRNALVGLVMRVAAREDEDDAYAARHGYVPRGILACNGAGHGLRFETSNRTYDFLIQCDGRWIGSVDDTPPGTPGIRITFTEEEAKTLRGLYWSLFPRGPC